MTAANGLRAIAKHGEPQRHGNGYWSIALNGCSIAVMAGSSGPSYPEGYDPESSALFCVTHANQPEYFRSWRQALEWALHFDFRGEAVPA